MKAPRGKGKKIAVILLCVSITCAVAFACAIAVYMIERERDEAYYTNLSASFLSEVEVTGDAASADTVIE